MHNLIIGFKPPFYWSNYLRLTKSTAIPASYFEKVRLKMTTNHKKVKVVSTSYLYEKNLNSSILSRVDKVKAIIENSNR